MTVVSKRTAEMALVGLNVAWRAAAPRRNGHPLPPETLEAWRTAYAELQAIASAAEQMTQPSSAGGTGFATDDLTGRASSGGSERRAADSGPLAVTQVSSFLDCSPRAVRKAITDGRLPARKVGRQWLLEATDVERFKQTREKAA